MPKAEILENFDESDEPTQQAPASADGSQGKRRRNHPVDEPNNAGPSEPSNKNRQKKPVPDDSGNAGPSQESGVTSLRRSTRSASIHMR